MENNYSQIKYVFLDFDGVLTNNKIICFSNSDAEAVICDRSDSLGIEMLKKSGVEVAVISKEKNSVVKRRCKKLNIECLNGINDKWNILSAILNEREINTADVCFVGNDINDLECMQNVGFSFAPADARQEVISIAGKVSKHNGGDGCVRELADLILFNQNVT